MEKISGIITPESATLIARQVIEAREREKRKYKNLQRAKDNDNYN